MKGCEGGRETGSIREDSYCVPRAAYVVIRYLTCRQWLDSQLAILGRACLDFL